MRPLYFGPHWITRSWRERPDGRGWLSVDLQLINRVGEHVRRTVRCQIAVVQHKESFGSHTRGHFMNAGGART